MPLRVGQIKSNPDSTTSPLPYQSTDDVGKLLGEIIQEARNLTNAERCSVFLLDKDTNELVAKVFDGIVTVDEVGPLFSLVLCVLVRLVLFICAHPF